MHNFQKLLFNQTSRLIAIVTFYAFIRLQAISATSVDLDQNWDNRFDSQVLVDGTGNSYLALALTDRGELIAGGNIGILGGRTDENIFRYVDDHWESIGGGVAGLSGNARVYAIVPVGDELFVGGQFTVAGGAAVKNLAHWTGSAWEDIGGGVNGTIKAMAFVGKDLYVGGLFTQVGNVNATNIARWNGQEWSALEEGTSDIVEALHVIGQDLYVGGRFDRAGNLPASFIAKWDGNHWSTLADGLTNVGEMFPGVYQLISRDGMLYAAGTFTHSGTNSIFNIARWDGARWSDVGGGLTHLGNGAGVFGLAFQGDHLIASGSFRFAGSTNLVVRGIAQWDGDHWMAFPGEEMIYQPGTMVIKGDLFYASTSYIHPVSGALTTIARYKDGNWFPLVHGFPPTATIMKTVAVSGDTFYAGGRFITRSAAGTGTAYLVQWTGEMWQTVGGDLSGSPAALAVDGGNLYAAGSFSSAGGVEVHNIAQWDGSRWQALGEGIALPVNAVAAHNGVVYAGGSFGISRWDGAQWSSLGLTNFNVFTLVLSDSVLYAGGVFDTGSGVTVNRIVKWDGANWSTLGPDFDGNIASLATDGINLFAGGAFTHAGDISLNYLARWDGEQWSALGQGVNGLVRALVWSKNGALYVGGAFNQAGGQPTAYIAKWSQRQWTSLGSGMDSRVAALAIQENDVYIGGDFFKAGGKGSFHFAIWHEPVDLPILSAPSFASDTTFHFRLQGSAGSFYILETSADLSHWSVLSTNQLSQDYLDLSDDSPNSSTKFYRARKKDGP